MIPIYSKPVVSPMQPRTRETRSIIDVRSNNHPVRNELRKLCGNYNLSVSFEEDGDSLKLFSHIPGFVAILCRMEMDGNLIALGRGSVVLSRLNRNMERSMFVALNGSFLSAANHATKIFDSLRLNDAEQQKVTQKFGERYESVLEKVSEKASDKQKNYLFQLVQERLEEPEREEFLAKLDTLTKDQASEAIQSFVSQ